MAVAPRGPPVVFVSADAARPHPDEEHLLATLGDESSKVGERAKAANDLFWLRRCKVGDTILRPRSSPGASNGS
jgi:hypothetical protein